MATVTYELKPGEAYFPGGSFGQYTQNAGTNFIVPVIAFDAAADEHAYWDLEGFNLGAAATQIDVDIEWYGTAGVTTGSVVWEVALAAITPEVDTQDVETKAFATVGTVTDSHLGTTARRLHRATISLTGASLDSIAARDDVTLRIKRLGSNELDTMAGDAQLRRVVVSYSDV